MKHIIVISAHPDDEVLGAGGTLLKHKSRGDSLIWVITTSMLATQGFSIERIESRKREIDEVKRRLGFSKVYLLNYPTMSLDSTSLTSMIPQLSMIFTEVKPEVVYVMNRSDAHSDHRITFDAVMACTKSFRYPSITAVLMYECISETEFAPALAEHAFLPNYFVDISEYFQQKIDIMKVYESELGDHPFPRSIRNIEALATFRGATIGAEYAEAFQVIKLIDR